MEYEYQRSLDSQGGNYPFFPCGQVVCNYSETVCGRIQAVTLPSIKEPLNHLRYFFLGISSKRVLCVQNAVTINNGTGVPQILRKDLSSSPCLPGLHVTMHSNLWFIALAIGHRSNKNLWLLVSLRAAVRAPCCSALCCGGSDSSSCAEVLWHSVSKYGSMLFAILRKRVRNKWSILTGFIGAQAGTATAVSQQAWSWWSRDNRK